MSFRASALGFLLALFTSLAALAQQSVQDPQQDNVHKASDQHGDHPHAGIAEDSSALPLEELQMFADVFNQIRQGYVESVPDSKLFELAVQGMLSGLDPHSVFLKEKAFDSLQETTKGEFSGLGIEIGQDRGYVTIIAPIDGSPAEAAGLEAGDVILKIDGESVRDLPVNKSVELMRGPTGSEVLLTIGRRGVGDPFDVTVIRDIIKVPSVRSRELMEGYLWLRASQFQRDTGQESIAKLESALSEGPLRGIVLDLRNNPGGVLGASVDMAGAFLDGGLVVYTEGRHPQSKDRFEATPGDMLNEVPIVVLINGGSASASEIVAGALQDRRRAVIMGTRSFGKGSVQTILPVTNTRAVKLTTALYYTPNGRSIQAEGIVPDIVIERAEVKSVETDRRTKEADLQGSLSGGDPADSQSESEALTELRNSDNQLYEALTLLRGINLLSPQSATDGEPMAGTESLESRTTENGEA
ncbi:S41 family peptidase [Luminiphilus sp.]|nr:S41 family peptidase [Luminiphilus sp.]MDA9711657.1 S41 family peptidase [Luminiphilus sp.]